MSTLESLDDFYTGDPAHRAPSPFTPEDFAAHRAEWVEPARLAWQGLEVCEMPPNSRGYLVLRLLHCQWKFICNSCQMRQDARRGRHGIKCREAQVARKRAEGY